MNMTNGQDPKIQQNYAFAQPSDLSRRLISAQEEERRRIAHEVHDELGQSLTALKFELASLAQHLPSKPAFLHQKTAAMQRMVDAILDTLRRLTTALWPRVLDDFGLVVAVEWQVREFRRHTGMMVTLTVSPEPIQPAPAVATTVYRLLQEALTNVARHARATEVTIRLRVAGNVLRLVVWDNGQGIAQDALRRPDRLGLAGMRERVMACGGDLRIWGRQGTGTVILARLPLRPWQDDPRGDTE